MKKIVCGTDVEVTEPNEVFKYVSKSGTEYILMCLHVGPQDGLQPCDGCVFSYGSSHPLRHASCAGNSLDCDNKIFIAIDQVLENI